MAFWKIEKGKEGEDRALAHLKEKGFSFLWANYRTRVGELDLVMKDGDTVVFVEVKSRMDLEYGTPQEHVTRKKQEKMVKTALWFLKERGLTNAPCRFDVVALGPGGTEHIPNAFQPNGRRYTL